MVIKLYISGISGNKEVKKKQQRVQMILDSKQITYEAIDITEPGKEKDKEFMQQNGKVREDLGKYPLPPQIFNDDDFCGDYEDFDMANEVDELEKFLHIATSPKIINNDSKQNEECDTVSESGLNNSSYNPYDYHTYKIKWDAVNGVLEELIESTTGENEKVNGNEEIEENKQSEVNGIADDVATPNENDSEIEPKTPNEDVPVTVKEGKKEAHLENGEEESSEKEPEEASSTKAEEKEEAKESGEGALEVKNEKETKENDGDEDAFEKVEEEKKNREGKTEEDHKGNGEDLSEEKESDKEESEEEKEEDKKSEKAELEEEKESEISGSEEKESGNEKEEKRNVKAEEKIEETNESEKENSKSESEKEEQDEEEEEEEEEE